MKKCPDCHVPEGDTHFDGCPNDPDSFLELEEEDHDPFANTCECGEWKSEGDDVCDDCADDPVEVGG